MKKGTIAIIVGIIVGGLFVALGQSMAIYFIYPHEAITDRPLIIGNDIPITSKIILALNWVVAAFSAGIISTFISGRTSPKPMLASVGVLNVLTLINLFILPHPKWMWIASLASFIPIGYIAYFLIRKKKTDENA